MQQILEYRIVWDDFCPHFQHQDGCDLIAKKNAQRYNMLQAPAFVREACKAQREEFEEKAQRDAQKWAEALELERQRSMKAVRTACAESLEHRMQEARLYREEMEALRAHAEEKTRHQERQQKAAVMRQQRERIQQQKSIKQNRANRAQSAHKERREEHARLAFLRHRHEKQYQEQSRSLVQSTRPLAGDKSTAQHRFRKLSYTWHGYQREPARSTVLPLLPSSTVFLEPGINQSFEYVTLNPGHTSQRYWRFLPHDAVRQHLRNTLRSSVGDLNLTTDMQHQTLDKLDDQQFLG
eukprot:TRINITY_DN11702_c0_g1_i2.p1 TRINITY_DN11702_c0_g1~~TRINITY_DN11702_c0_g1_i2.p1  ORF type:complete len:295 (+),score=39.87 TRINITY_DN11702_c0_g1_i2:752-1636(+)